MLICITQVKSLKGDIDANIQHHKSFVELAIANGADAIIFPELSITNYEPALAKELATIKDDSRFDVFQQVSDKSNIIIGIGAPIQSSNGINISMVLFQPGLERQVYCKKHLHPDEDPFFVSGLSTVGLIGDKKNIAFAICYEVFVPEHSANAHNRGAEIYIASVAKSAKGVEKAFQSLGGLAKHYSMHVLMSNAVGVCDDFESAGNSAVWSKKGELLAKLGSKEEGIVLFDTETLACTTKTLAREMA